jgi:hypothetical protein
MELMKRAPHYLISLLLVLSLFVPSVALSQDDDLLSSDDDLGSLLEEEDKNTNSELSSDSDLLGGDLLDDEEVTKASSPQSDELADTSDGVDEDTSLSSADSDLLDTDLLDDKDLTAKSSSDSDKAGDTAHTSAAVSSDEIHQNLFIKDRFPSAKECKTCHEGHFREWSSSPHAYAQISPVFNSMHATIVKASNGTNGDFCIRCHTPIGIQMGEPELARNEDRAPVSFEGVTCVVCHRMEKNFGKISGRFPIKEGDIFAPVFGPEGNEELRRVLEDKNTYKAAASADEQGRPIHGDIVRFAPIDKPSFCGTCHDVTLLNGFRLEEAFSEYKGSPAAAKGQTCQDCHMGLTPGVASGYAMEPAAIIGGEPTRVRKRSDHLMVGPDYSVVHPGIFPHNFDAKDLATPTEWEQFDYEAGWGTPEFEDKVTEDFEFPEAWESLDDRIEARKIVLDQLALLEETAAARKQLLKRGYVLGEPEVLEANIDDGLEFRVKVSNGADGHNVPTGFIAERLVFVRVTVKNATGDVVFVSGDLDPNGDVRDAHSLYVHNGKLPLDDQLFSLQSLFIVRANRGGEREQVLAINLSADSLLYTRPETRSSILQGGTGGARIHRRGIEPGGHRWVNYKVAPDLLEGGGKYSVTVQLIAGMVPVNLIDAIKGVGFDYGLSAKKLADRVVAGHQILWEHSKEVNLEVN